MIKTFFSVILIIPILVACSGSHHEKYNKNDGQKIAKNITPQMDGKKLMQTYCLACHSDKPAYGNHEGLTAPPFPGVVMHYKEKYPKREDFIKAVSAYVKQPDSTKAVMQGAIREFGLMPPLPLPDDTLKAIAGSLYDLYGHQRRGKGHGRGHGRRMGRGMGRGMH